MAQLLLQSADGAMTDLGTLGGASSTAIAINDSGQIIGESETRGGAIYAVQRTTQRVLYLPQISTEGLRSG